MRWTREMDRPDSFDGLFAPDGDPVGEIDRARHTVQTVVSATERRGVTGG